MKQTPKVHCLDCLAEVITDGKGRSIVIDTGDKEIHLCYACICAYKEELERKKNAA